MASLVLSVLPLGGSDHNPLTMSDDHILEEIYSTHVHSDTKFDVDSLFTLVDNILKSSTHVVDNVVQGNQGSLEHVDNRTAPASFTSPLCTLKQINSEMSCKPPGEEIAHKTTLAILNKLSSYSWVAKAVLTHAAFALEYGEFWLLSHQHLPTEPLAKSLAIIKRVPELTKPSALQKHRSAILELNNLVKATWQVVEAILELEKLTSYDTKDVPGVASALEQLPVDAYWAIITIVAVVTEIDCLTTDSNNKQELSQFGQKINIIFRKLRKQISLCKLKIEEAEYEKMLVKMFQTPTEVMDVFKVLIFGKDTPHAPIYDGSTKISVDIEVLKKKDVFLFISTLDITEEEISIFNPIYDHITKIGNQYKIVWVPIVEEWNDELRNKFESLKSKIRWYVLHHFAPIKGINYIKKEWQFKKKPLVAVLNPQGKILHQNAFHMIQVWGLKGFPFSISIQESLTQASMWVDSLVTGIDIKFKWEEKNVIIYGGKDKEWIQQFNKFASALANDAIIKEANVSIELFSLESQQPNVISNFWKGVESLFVTKMHNTTDSVTQQVEKLLSYKNETGWALLTKDSIVVFVGHGTTVLKTVAEFDKWKGEVIEKGFEITFKEQFDKVASTVHLCSHLEIPNVGGKIPDKIECPECHRTMEVFISYKCCHDGDTTNAEH